jgi:DNA-binding transcriptional regulator/RsmH inhibitor MraZ
MALNETTEPKYYNAEYRHGVDEKRRVQIPAKWRPTEPGTELTLVLWPKAREGACLRVLLPQQMAKLMQDVNALPNSDTNKVVLKRFIGSGSVQVALDKAGRIWRRMRESTKRRCSSGCSTGMRFGAPNVTSA